MRQHLQVILFSISFALCISMTCSAQIPIPSPASGIVLIASPTPVPSATPDPSLSPVPVVSVAAPPQWAQDLLVNAEKLPIVGPYVAKVILYAGIVAAVLTALVAFLLTLLSAIGSVANISGLSAFSQKLQDFKNGQVMYWLKYLSMFNAQKPQDPSPTVTLSSSVAQNSQ